MKVEQQVLEKLRELPLEKQRQVLDFVESLADENGAKEGRRSLRGLWKNLNIDVTEDDIAQARREM